MEIGAVKVDIHKNENQYRLINFSDVNCIKGLIKNRSIVDPYIEMETDNNIYHAGVVQPVNQEIIAIFVDLDRLIERCKFGKKRKEIIHMLMSGWTETDIAKVYRQNVLRIYGILKSICKKIKKINDSDWKYEYIYLSYLPVRWEYKQCSKCGEWKPKTVEFFSFDITNNMFKSSCLVCHNQKD